MTDFTMQKDADGVAIITWDVPGKSMNVLSLDGAAELDALIDEALADDAVKGIVITSGKKDFAAGMDLNVIAGMKGGGAQAVFDGIMSLHHVLRKIERAGMDPKTLKGGKPIAAGSLAGLGAAQLEDVASGRLLAEVVVESEHAVHLGAGQIECLCDHRDRGLRHVAERFLQRVQDHQRGAFKPGMFGDDLSAARPVPRFVSHRHPRFSRSVFCSAHQSWNCSKHQ